MKKRFIETGRITGTHGVRGEMRAEPWCDQPSDLTKYKTLYLDKEGQNPLKIKSARVHKNMVLITAEGILSIEDAEKLRGKKLYLDRNDLKLKKGDYLIVDLIDCQVFDTQTGKKYGEISDVTNLGASDIWHVKNEGKEYLIPAIPTVIDQVDVDNGRITITPMKGIFDDED